MPFLRVILLNIDVLVGHSANKSDSNSLRNKKIHSHTDECSEGLGYDHQGHVSAHQLEETVKLACSFIDSEIQLIVEAILYWFTERVVDPT